MRSLALSTRATCFVLALIVFPAAVPAEERKTPYDAIVDVEGGDVVRAGGKKTFYATDKLKRGDRVRVLRHDPGGWCMIDPPEGSYSWIRADNVQRKSETTGILIANHVVVRVGSNLNPEEATVIQGDLSKGAAVEILGEQKFEFDDGSQLMYKISPVKNEARWIARKSIVPADAYRPDPFSSGSPQRKKRNEPVADMDVDAFTKPISTNTNSQREANLAGTDSISSGTNTRRKESEEDRQQLSTIDLQFRDMVRQDPSAWDLDSLESQYIQLDDDVGVESFSKIIKTRLEAVKRYRKTQKDYVDFMTVSNNAKQRDADLSAGRIQPNVDAPQTQQLIPNANQTAMAMASTATTGPIGQPTNPMANRTAPQPAAGTPQFDGAGVVVKMSKSFPGGPQYALIHPQDGRLLSLLDAAPGVNLNSYVNRKMGITGQRTHRNDWNSDVIIVRSLQPVRFPGD